ncbi:GIY-YIG nuclease family protein [Marinicella sediminis]|uniref:GIY-YIG nuclease family protein n=1 Tax=Marinicella sediminis TaxID=1792834 RepID=A0ABV7J5D8_9GAMM|nr:GIY-YIG nuclease family protein [Marinicella sediminis]
MKIPEHPIPESWSVYLLLCDRKVIYTGIAKDPQLRLSQHQQGAPLGAKFTRRFKNIELVYHTIAGDRSAASKIEYLIKKLPAKTKHQIIKQQPDCETLCNWLEQ